MAQPYRRNDSLWSNYYITVNFNQPGLDNAGAVNLAEHITSALVSPGNMWTWLHAAGAGQFVGADRQLIQRVRARPSIEQNPGGSPHVHILLEIQHRSRVRLDYPAIRALMTALVPGSNTDCRFVQPGQTDEMIKYGNKQNANFNVPGQLGPTQFNNGIVQANSGAPDVSADEDLIPLVVRRYI